MTEGVKKMSDLSTRSSDVREEFRVRGGQLLDKVSELVAAGNVRSIIVKHDGKVVVEIPLTVGVIGTLLAPQLAALGAIAALLTESTVEVVRTS
jgi:hypothetical protein